MKDVTVAAMRHEAALAGALDHFGDEWFMGALTAWAEDLKQQNLNQFGRGFLRSLVVRDLTRRLRVLATLHEHPEIADVPIPQIVYITGLERSGTTLLHNLLALHPRGRALLRWELMEPVPPPTVKDFATDPRIRAVQASIDKLRGSALEGMHWVNAEEPEECVWGFIDAVGMLGQAAVMCMPQWNRFIAEEDLTHAFENYRRVVQILLWKHPVEPGGFLVLKAPQIAAHVATFAKVFPEAHFVITDRDPYRCVVSLAVLGHTIVDPFCIDNPLIDDGQRQRQVLSFARSKLAALSSFTQAEPNRVLHVGYPRLMSDPAATVETVLSTVGISATEDMADRVEAFLAAQRSGARVAPPRELATMGYDHDEVLAVPVIADYCQRFGIEPERSRLTGAQPPA